MYATLCSQTLVYRKLVPRMNARAVADRRSDTSILDLYPQKRASQNGGAGDG